VNGHWFLQYSVGKVSVIQVLPLTAVVASQHEEAGSTIAVGAARTTLATIDRVILERLDIDSATFERGTGWAINPEGACKGDVCVPLPNGFEVTDTVDRLGMALVHDAEQDVWAVGPETFGGRALVTAEAPDLVLGDINGSEFRLSSLRGQKVVLVAWAPY
jgi:hypothetical protein